MYLKQPYIDMLKHLRVQALYRWLKENKIRGTVEKVYSIKEDHINDGESLETIIQILDIGLLNIMEHFTITSTRRCGF